MNRVVDKNCSKRTILLIDDSSDDNLQTGLLLQKFGYAVLPAPTVAAALDLLSVAKPAGVMADANLEGLNLLTLVKRDPRFSDMPVILMRSSPVQDRHAGVVAAAWLDKPVAVEALYRVAESVIEKRPRQSMRVDTALQAKVGTGEVVGTIGNLSEFGLFFQACDLLPIHIEVPISFEIKRVVIRVKAVVLYVSKNTEGDARETGMGMKFISISPEDRALVKAYVLEQFHKST